MSYNADEGGYETIPDTGADSYNLIDPTGKSEDYMNSLYSNQQNVNNQMSLDASDPASFMSQFMNNFGALQSGVTDATSPLSQQLQSQVKSLTGDAVSEVSNDFSGMNSLYGSGMASVAGERAGEIGSRAGVDLANAQLGLLGSLSNNTMGQMGQYNNTVLNNAGAAFTPEYASPEVAYQPSEWEQFMQALPFFG